MKALSLKTFLVLGLGLLLLSIGLLKLTSKVQAQVSFEKPYMTDNDWIRVGLTKSGVMDWSYTGVTISSTQGLGVFQGPDNKGAALELPANAKLSFSRLPQTQTLVLQWQDASGQSQTSQLEAPVRVYSRSDNGLLKIEAIQKKGQNPQYRGYFDVVPDPDKPENLSLVNVIPLNSYLQGVVPNEMPTGFGVEASKTQAVLARNYAIKPREKPFKVFDICDSPYCQAYYGALTENSQVNQLIQQTQGVVALYQGDPIIALYSSTHGGVSESHENVFNDGVKYPGIKIPYLSGRSDMPLDKDLTIEANARAFYQSKPQSYDIDSPLYRWQRKANAKDLVNTFNASLLRFKKSSFVEFQENPKAVPTGKDALFTELKEILVLQRGISGKVMRLKLVTDAGTWTISKEGNIRQLFEGGAQKALPSANFVVTHTKGPDGKLGTVTLDGGGFGHGVGMSQYGAGYLSKKGTPFSQIIKHYYKQVQIGTIPLTVTQEKLQNRLDFVPPVNKAKLMVKASQPGTLRISLNNKPLDIVVMEPNKLSSQDITGLIYPNQRNGLQASFNSQATEVTPWLAKVWLEFE